MDPKYGISNKQWNDVTAEFFEAVKEIDIGELCHVFLFGLFEAMSAIEMMDPKMDSGMKKNEEISTLTFDKAVESGTMKLAAIPHNEVIGVVDACYTCLVSWLEGNSLAQTVLTCLYLHQPMKIEDSTMKAFSVAILKLIDLTIEQITSIKVYEEEDFQASSYGYDLCEKITSSESIAMLKKAEEELIKIAKTEEEPSDVILAVTARLKFTRFLLQILTILEPKPDSITTEAEICELIKLLNAALEVIPTIRNSLNYGVPANHDVPCTIGFSSTINQRLLPPTFPRFTKFLDRNSSYTYFEELIQRIKTACKIIYCTNFQTALGFFLNFSKARGSCLLSRTILQRLYFRDAPNSDNVFGYVSFENMLRDSIQEFVSPEVLFPDHPFHSNQLAQGCIKSFLFFNQSSFSSLLEVCGYNLARQREKFAKLLGSFRNLQEEAERVDNFFCKKINATMVIPSNNLAYFGTWVLYYTLRLQILYILSGLELELYSIHELPYIYWYLSEFLYGWLVSCLNRAESYSDSNTMLKSKASKKNKTNKKNKIRLHSTEIMFSQALQNLCGGYYKCLGGLMKDGKIPQPLPMFNNEKMRFEHRFSPFFDLSTPPPMSYMDFKRMELQMLKISSAELFSAAAKHFHQTKVIIEMIPKDNRSKNLESEMQALLKVSKFNFIVCNLLANGHKKESFVPPTFDFKFHKCYPIIIFN